MSFIVESTKLETNQLSNSRNLVWQHEKRPCVADANKAENPTSPSWHHTKRLAQQCPTATKSYSNSWTCHPWKADSYPQSQTGHPPTASATKASEDLACHLPRGPVLISEHGIFFTNLTCQNRLQHATRKQPKAKTIFQSPPGLKSEKPDQLEISQLDVTAMTFPDFGLFSTSVCR